MALISTAQGPGDTKEPRATQPSSLPDGPPEDVHSHTQTFPCNLIKFLKQRTKMYISFYPLNKTGVLFIVVDMMDYSLGQRIDYVILFEICSHIEWADWKSYGSISQKKCLGLSQ